MKTKQSVEASLSELFEGLQRSSFTGARGTCARKTIPPEASGGVVWRAPEALAAGIYIGRGYFPSQLP